MSNARARAMIARLGLAASMSLPCVACAHAFGERYDLPAPLSYFVFGAAATVALSFAVVAMIAHGVSRSDAIEGRVLSLGPLLTVLRLICRIAAVVAFALIVVAALFGTRNPELNLAPTAVWIIGWFGLSLFAACVANVWPLLDPWPALFDAADAAARRWGATRGATLGWKYPQALGAWPAVALLLLFTWIEVIYLYASVPARIGELLLIWSAVTLTGMVCFGREVWQRNGDVFAIYFATLGRLAPLGAGPDERSVVVRPFGRGLITAPAQSVAMVGFMIAMLSTVLFDGLLAGQLWTIAQFHFNRSLPQIADDRGYVIGTIGLVAVWLFFFAVYLLACLITARLVRGRSTLAIARLFALTLVPIAVAYNIAHNLSSLLVQGQLMIPLLSDPLGRGWNLFGTKDYYPDISVVDARFTWYVAIGTIVAGHVVSIWLAHRVALREFKAKAVSASGPLTVLMVIYTAISLAVIAEPLVQFRAPGAASTLTR